MERVQIIPGSRGMVTKSLRLSDSLVSAVQEIGHHEQIEEAAAMRKLLRMGYGLYLAEEYRAGRLTLRDLGHRLELSLSETLEMLQRLGITGNTGAADTLASYRSTSKATGRQ